MNGRIMQISRMRQDTDGPGITTLVAMYGCPLKCKYCINDFCHSKDTLTAEFSAEELVEELSIDELYFKMLGGGVVFGGGEPLLQAIYIEEVCKALKDKYEIRMETTLYAPWEDVERLIPYVGMWIVDIKDIDPNIYMNYTGASNGQVVRNLKKLSEIVDKEKIYVRVPRIPMYNTLIDVEVTKRLLTKWGLSANEFQYKV